MSRLAAWAFLSRFCWALMLLTLSACSDSPRLDYLHADARLLAFGDSLTRGTGAEVEQSYPAHLSRLIDRQVINEGIPGEVSAEGLARLPGVLDRVQPDLLLLCHGGNDILRSLDEVQLAQNLQAMIDLALARGIDVVLIPVPKRSLLLRAEPLYRQLAERNQLPLAPDIVADVLGEASLRSDRIHPNGEGYGKIAAALAELLAERGAL